MSATAKNYPLQLNQATQIFSERVDGLAPCGPKQIMLACATYPSAGLVSVEFRYIGDATWRKVPKATSLPIVGPLVFYAYGAIEAYRVTLSGIVGGSGLAAWVSDMDAEGFPPGIFEGLRAITTQPYTEANVKNGLQFYGRAVWGSGDEIAAGTTRKIWFKTGSKTVIVKIRDFHYLAEELILRLYAAPTGVTGGTDLVIHNYNNVNPVATTVQAKKNVTTATNGTEFDGSDPEHFFGSASVGQRAPNSIPQGRERIVGPNAEFLIAIENPSSGPAKCQYYLDWYEGTPDLPL